MEPLVAFLSFSPSEMLVVAVVALLLFGGKLPEMARTWGRTFAEFRRNLAGIQSEINEAIYAEPDRLEYRPSAAASDVDPDYPEGPLDLGLTVSEESTEGVDADEDATEMEVEDPTEREAAPSADDELSRS